ncbi:DNA polymerase III subunit gamma/tau [Alkaliphilus peptidifermentans]|uniref:DNA-directed DNA polymerase n=1 Tax=Alkaliphilus peptidifermentans DSM 18978 TaxID=1120976 RepID=A0A1G5HGR2_9FIRM|nr:DNA polymerase III subunit gamma/tau [Alkaliphilus peptidifermentans]SCY62500.1 DNA polymerase-3 subunit gamma/tau [Alkaliphilus peptidifermentans DSM 18978]
MSYKALYRKWRPQIFEDIVGQQHIVTTLKNQIRKESLSHAYLFSGTRGTGKTSTAKIFARAVNCISPIEENPCNLCEICRGITTESIMDVIEIDAASNNGVDHIREIRENVKYPPSKGKYKVYIVDEVHMLSTGAFNALLKTLEEPPKHVIFILATTEPQKLPATILSRCQRFDFKPVKIKDIENRLIVICQSESISYDEKALRVIATNGRGSLRDSLSILEQCISFTQGELSYEKVTETLGIASDDFLIKLMMAIAMKKSSEALTLIQQMVMEGKDLQQLIKELISYLRKLLMIMMKVDIEEIHIDSQEINIALSDIEALLKEKEIIEMIYKLSEAEAKIKYATQPQIIIEVTIVDMCHKRSEPTMNDLLERIEKLERLVDGSAIAAVRKDRESIGINHAKEINEDINVIYKTAEMEENENATMGRGIEKENSGTMTSAEVAGGLPPDFNVIKDKWNDVLEKIRQNKKAQIKAFLMEGSLISLKGKQLIIGFKEGYGFHREALDKEKTKEFLSDIIKQVSGQGVTLSFVMENEAAKVVDKVDYSLERLKKAVPNEILKIVEE